MCYITPDLFLTLRPPAPTMQPESSDGFASVGTILPEEGAALLPGGSFRFLELSCGLGRSWIGDGIGPRVAAGFAEPVVRGFDGFECGVFGAAFGTDGNLVGCCNLFF